MLLLSQRDPRWSGHVLGFGPALGTIGNFGCFLTCLAMVVWDAFSDMRYLPSALDEVFTAGRIFVRESTGTSDLLPDAALDLVWPKRFATSAYAGYRADLIRTAVPTSDTYVVLWISTASVPTHFVIAYSADGRYIADPWTGQVGSLAGYGGPGAVHKTLLIKKLPQAPPAPAPAPVVAPAPRPAPIPVVPPPPTYSVALGAATVASGLSFDAALARARSAAAAKPGTLYAVLDAKGATVDTEFVALPPAPVPPAPVPTPTPPPAAAPDYSLQGILIALLNALLWLSGRR